MSTTLLYIGGAVLLLGDKLVTEVHHISLWTALPICIGAGIAIMLLGAALKSAAGKKA